MSSPSAVPSKAVRVCVSTRRTLVTPRATGVCRPLMTRQLQRITDVPSSTPA